MPDDLPPVYGGKILHVYLDTGETEVESIDPEDARKFLGGNGLAAKLISEHVPTDSGPFDPENTVVFTVGPMNLTQFQTTSRGAVGFVGPVMNGFSDGTFGETFPVHRDSSGSRQSPSAGGGGPVVPPCRRGRGEVEGRDRPCRRDHLRHL